MKSNYYIDRCKEYGITDENNYVAWKGDESKQTLKQPIFEEDRQGNIRIYYYDLRGCQYYYKPSEEGYQHKFYRTRLQNPEREGRKYTQSKNSGTFPFFTPGLITKYLYEKNFPTLFITEGEFKAFKGYLAGLDIMAFPSIHGTYTREAVFTTLHRDIVSLIHKCGVKNLVFITDADTFTINFKPDKDLKKRPQSFYTAIKNFWEAAFFQIEDKHSPLQHAYWGHIRTEYNPIAKGLDDLFIQNPTRKKDITEDLVNFHFDRFFNGYHLSDSKIKALQKEFGLKDASNFYSVYRQFISNREFVFGRSRYQYNGEEVKYQKHEDAEKFFRVGSDWYKNIKVENRFGIAEEKVIPFKVGEIQRDYKRYDSFLDDCSKYDWFCSKPCFDENYEPVINNCLNVMKPLPHTPEKGGIEHSLEFIKHLFDNKNQIRTYHFNDVKSKKEIKHTIVCEEEGSQLSVALDMLALMLQKPLQKLPVLCLVSPEEGTGKSTFLFWQQSLFGANAVILDNERFKMSFNSHYATKYFVGLDEGFLEIEKKAEKERLKNMVTAPEISLEDKGANVKVIPNHIHLTICSNDADRIMYMDDNDSRWFVVRVPKFTKENPHILKQLQEELPAWIHYLQNRSIIHLHQGRLWFTKDQIRTEQMQAIIKNSKPKLDRLIEDIVKDMFMTYGILKIDMDVKWLTDTINREFRYKVDRTDVRKFFKEKKGLTPSKNTRIRIPFSFDINRTDENGNAVINYYETQSRPFTLYVEDWLTEDDDAGAIELLTKRKQQPNGHSSKHEDAIVNHNNSLGDDIPF